MDRRDGSREGMVVYARLRGEGCEDRVQSEVHGVVMSTATKSSPSLNLLSLATLLIPDTSFIPSTSALPSDSIVQRILDNSISISTIS